MAHNSTPFHQNLKMNLSSDSDHQAESDGIKKWWFLKINIMVPTVTLTLVQLHCFLFLVSVIMFFN